MAPERVLLSRVRVRGAASDADRGRALELEGACRTAARAGDSLLLERPLASSLLAAGTRANRTRWEGSGACRAPWSPRDGPRAAHSPLTRCIAFLCLSFGPSGAARPAVCARSWRPAAAGGRLLRCSRCGVARYADRDAQRSAWGAHRVECGALAAWGKGRAARAPAAVLLVARLAWAARADGDDCMARASALRSHWVDLSDERKAAFATLAAGARALMLGGEAPDADAAGLPSVRETARLLAAVACNAHTVCDAELAPLGVALYGVASAANHSARPNAVQRFDGDVIELRALRDIAPGEEVCISYVDALMPADEARARLLAEYHFDLHPEVAPAPAPQPDAAAGGALVAELQMAVGASDEAASALDGGGGVVAWLTSELDRPSVGGFFGLEVEGGDNGDIPSVMHWGVSQVLRDAVVSGAAEVVRALATAERSLDAGNTSAAREALVRAEAMSARAGLSAAHSLRLRVAQCTVRLHIGAQEWDAALGAARKASAAFDALSVGGSVVTPQHAADLATLAKLEAFAGEPKLAIRGARQALEMLRLTHGDGSVADEARRSLAEAEADLREAMTC